MLNGCWDLCGPPRGLTTQQPHPVVSNSIACRLQAQKENPWSPGGSLPLSREHSRDQEEHTQVQPSPDQARAAWDLAAASPRQLGMWWWFSHKVMSNSYDTMDCSLPGFSVHKIFQARILEWVAISFSRGSSRPRNRTRVSCIVGRFFTN